MNKDKLLAERERLLRQYMKAKREDRRRIVAKLFILDEELEGEHEGRQSVQRDRRYRLRA